MTRATSETFRDVGEMDTRRLSAYLDTAWEEAAASTLSEYIQIPCKSPDFDSQWAEHAHLYRAAELLACWAERKLAQMPGAHVQVVRLPDRTPVIFIDVPGEITRSILVYGHLDKQPEITGWSTGLSPWTPVRRAERLYGRGGADDGYAIFAAVSALLALREQKIAHGRCVILIEASEESGSCDLPYYLEHLKDRIGDPSLVIGLDAGCGDYERCWITTSVRGMVTGKLTVAVLTHGVHSGDASGIVPSSFGIARSLLSRLEDEATGHVKVPSLHQRIPDTRVEQAKAAAHVLGEGVYRRFPWFETTEPTTQDVTELILRRTWRPRLTVTGITGLPDAAAAASVLLPYTTLKLSLRLPPTVPARQAGAEVRRILESEPPYRSHVRFELEHAVDGWDAPPMAPWLDRSVAAASRRFFRAPAGFMGEGGSIPFMAMLGERFPRTQFLLTGVLGPHSNAHGPDEFLHVPTAKRLSGVIARVIADHGAHPAEAG